MLEYRGDTVARVGVATPLARKVARDAGLSLMHVSGTGPAGRILRRDVVGHLQPTAQPGTPGERTSRSAVSCLEPRERLPVEGASQSLQSTPTAWMLVEVDVSHLYQRTSVHSERPDNTSPPTDAFVTQLIQAVSRSLGEHPVLNSVWRDKGILLRRHLMLAVIDTRRGGQPVLIGADAQRLPATQTSVPSGNGGQEQQATEPPTFTIVVLGDSSPAMIGQIALPPEQAACLVASTPARRLVACEAGLALRDIAMIGVTFDHRILDGATAASFLRMMKAWLEGPVESSDAQSAER